MRRFLLVSVLMFVASAFCGNGRALGQGLYGPRIAGPVQYPTVSPYINLLRGGNPPWLNYAGLVRPQVNFQYAVSGLSQQVAANQLGISTLEGATGLISTGHPSSYLNTSHFFLYRGSATPGTYRPTLARGAAGTQQAQPGGRGAPRATPAPR